MSLTTFLNFVLCVCVYFKLRSKVRRKLSVAADSKQVLDLNI